MRREDHFTERRAGARDADVDIGRNDDDRRLLTLLKLVGLLGRMLGIDLAKHGGCKVKRTQCRRDGDCKKVELEFPREGHGENVRSFVCAPQPR